MIRRVAWLTVAVLMVTGCRVDVIVDLDIRSDGSGEVVVTAIADDGVVEQTPGLADELRFDDAVAAGWVVEGPAATDAGGLTVTLRHGFATAEEASVLLASLGPPVVGPSVTRRAEGGVSTVELRGQLVLDGGFEAFADSDLVAAVGGPPFADQLASSLATPAGSMSVTVRASLPGEIETTGASAGGTASWNAPLDGTTVDLTTRAVVRPAPGWASVVATAALVLLVAWLLVVAGVAYLVVRARRRRAGRPDLGPIGSRRLDELGPSSRPTG
ncbi:hypothetical protein BH18ACT2_BH18ACT2_16750 [soil metagenome]